MNFGQFSKGNAPAFFPRSRYGPVKGKFHITKDISHIDLPAVRDGQVNHFQCPSRFTQRAIPREIRNRKMFKRVRFSRTPSPGHEANDFPPTAMTELSLEAILCITPR